MDQFSYIISLLSIITGLALSDIAISLHRLLKRRSDVRWDWFTLAIAAYVFFVLVRYWYQVWSIRDFTGATELIFFLSIIIENLVLFLVAAASLPDEADFGAGVLDLREFQQRNSVYIWRLFLLFSVMWAAHGLYFAGVATVLSGDKITLVVFLVPVLLAAAIAFARRRQAQVILFGAILTHEAWWMVTSRF